MKREGALWTSHALCRSFLMFNLGIWCRSVMSDKVHAEIPDLCVASTPPMCQYYGRLDCDFMCGRKVATSIGRSATELAVVRRSDGERRQSRNRNTHVRGARIIVPEFLAELWHRVHNERTKLPGYGDLHFV